MPVHIIDKSKFVDEEGEINSIDRMRGTLLYGLHWYDEMEAQKKIVAQLSRFMDDKYYLIRNLALPGLDIPIPIIIVGPQGVRILYVSHLAGFFEAREEEWNAINNRTNQFEPTEPNLIKRTLLFSRAVNIYLEKNELQIPNLEPVLVFSNPGIHVDTDRPVVRIVLIDAFNRFASTLVQASGILSRDDTKKIVDTLLHPPQPEVSAEAKAPRSSMFESIPFLNSINFTKRQWIILGIIFTINIIILFLMVITVILTL